MTTKITIETAEGHLSGTITKTEGFNNAGHWTTAHYLQIEDDTEAAWPATGTGFEAAAQELLGTLIAVAEVNASF